MFSRSEARSKPSSIVLTGQGGAPSTPASPEEEEEEEEEDEDEVDDEDDEAPPEDDDAPDDPSAEPPSSGMFVLGTMVGSASLNAVHPWSTAHTDSSTPSRPADHACMRRGR